MKKFWGILLTAMVLLPLVSEATTIRHDTIRPPRPKVGIVLGGGGAKGAAHIGVLKYIEEIGLPVDYIVGTSMGSIIGGMYAMGYSPDEIQRLISQLDWSQYMSNSVNRYDISSADKQRRSSYLVSIPFNQGELRGKIKESINDDEEKSTGASFLSSLPSSFIGGTDLLNLFNSLCIGYQDPIDFNELPIPFACVATNITTGEETVLRQGKFPEAIRASMAIPGVFNPVTIDGNLLVDGGLVNNFPTDVAKSMGADIIIGIEVAQGLVTDPDNLKSLPQLVSQLKNIMVQGHNEENRKLCDLYFHPSVGDFGMLSFTSQAIDTIVNRGYQHAKQYRDQLLTIKNYIDSYQPSSKTLQAPPAQSITGNDTVVLKSITMDNVSDKEFKWLLRKSNLHLDEEIPNSDIQRAVNIFKGTGCFSSIQYWLTDNNPDNDKDFNLRFAFQPAEPHSFGIGVRYDSEESVSLLLHAGLNQNKFHGFKFNLTGRLGFNTKVNATLTYASLALANFNLAYDFHRAKHNLNVAGKLNAQVCSKHRFSFYVSEFHLRDIQVQVGAEYESTRFHEPVAFFADSSGYDNNLRQNVYGPYAKLHFDDMNQANFATKGIDASFEYHGRFENAGIGNYIHDFSLSFKYHGTAGKFTFIPQIYARVIPFKGVNSYSYVNVIGGEVAGRYFDYQMPFIGINNTTIVPDAAAIGRLDIRFNPFKKHYITAMFNVMHAANDLPTLFSYQPGPDITGYPDVWLFTGTKTYWGTGLQYAYGSPFGPISFTVHYSNFTKTVGTYFSLGFNF